MRAGGRLGKYLEDALTLPLDARASWRRDGLTGVWDEIASRTVYRVVRWSRSWLIVHTLDRARATPPPAGVRIERFEGPDWGRLSPIAGRRRLALFARMAGAGRVCLVAWRDDVPVGYAWVSDRMAAEFEGYPLELPAGVAYLWALYVPPRERNAGLGSALASARIRWAREHGFREGWRIVAQTNRASLRTVAKTAGEGTRIVGELRYLKLLAQGRTWLRPVRRGPDPILRA
ncbi:MAG TPA: GNAT family N-acetyltransferase [Gemmatimonadales bacterium]|nr:GNAT family N-acetyltransferase [Gemmatimonadales bacterium]